MSDPVLRPEVDTPAKMCCVTEVALILDCSPRHVRRLADSGLMPRPVHIGRLIRWQRLEIDKWIAAGCPSCRRGGCAMRQLYLFESPPAQAGQTLRLIRIRFLKKIIYGEVVDAGAGQQVDAYAPHIRYRVGAIYSDLHRRGLIKPVGADRASRPTRRGAVTWLWGADNLDACRRQLAADLADLAAE